MAELVVRCIGIFLKPGHRALIMMLIELFKGSISCSHRRTLSHSNSPKYMLQNTIPSFPQEHQHEHHIHRHTFPSNLIVTPSSVPALIACVAHTAAAA